MITAVDTNVLIDVFCNDPKFAAASADALRRSIQEGQIVLCEIVAAELAAVFPSTKAFEYAIGKLSIEFSPIAIETAVYAGKIWRRYHAQGGGPTRVIADFLIAAHAQHQCDQLLTRDRGFYRTYFKKLRVVAPAA